MTANRRNIIGAVTVAVIIAVIAVVISVTSKPGTVQQLEQGSSDANNTASGQCDYLSSDGAYAIGTGDVCSELETDLDNASVSAGTWQGAVSVPAGYSPVATVCSLSYGDNTVVIETIAPSGDTEPITSLSADYSCSGFKQVGWASGSSSTSCTPDENNTECGTQPVGNGGYSQQCVSEYGSAYPYLDGDHCEATP